MVALVNSSMENFDSVNQDKTNVTEERRYIYFNPNFCINNINVKELVSRAQKASATCLVEDVPCTVKKPVNAILEITDEHQTQTNLLGPDSYQSKSPRVVLLPTPTVQSGSPRTITSQHVTEIPGPSLHNTQYSSRSIDGEDRDHPWYPNHPSYGSNLLSLAADYSIRPNQPVRCRLPPLSKKELIQRMEKLYRQGSIRKYLQLTSLVEKFIRYMNILKDQIEFDSLQIDYTNNQSYAECRRKRAMMKRLNVNEYHYINEHVVDDLFARSQSLKCFKKKNSKELDLSQIDTSKLTIGQRKFLFFHHVLKQGKTKFVNENLGNNINEDAKPPELPELVSINKYKSVLKDSVVEGKRKSIRTSLSYRRSQDSSHQDCRFYMRTGKCKFGVRCIRKHDPSKLPVKLKKAAARKRPKSTFSVNNLSRKLITKKPLRIVSKFSLNNQVSRVLKSTNQVSRVLKSTVSQKHSVSVPSSSGASASASLFRTDYRFINNSTLGPTKVSMNRKSVRRALMWKRKTALQRKQDCMFFIRRGKCVFGEKCRKKHDPEKVVLCRKFIFSNTCTNDDCPYQHKVHVN